MKEIEGVVQLHGDGIVVETVNNQTFVEIEGISAYDFQSVILNQPDSWKIDLIKELIVNVGFDRVANEIDGLFTNKVIVSKN